LQVGSCVVCEATAGLLSVATTAVSSEGVAVVYSGEVGRSAACRNYNNGLMTLPFGTSVEWGEFCVLAFNLYEEVSLLC
jgi:hypothetical protein